MPKNKFQDVIFTIIMVFVMVYTMICYNIALNVGGRNEQPGIFKCIPRAGHYGTNCIHP